MKITAQQIHTMKCMNYAKIESLDLLLAEIEREDYQSVKHVKESIKAFLVMAHNDRKGFDNVET